MGIMIPTIMNLVVNLIYTILALWLAILTFRLVDRYVFTKIDFEDEIKKGNIAAAIFAATLLIFVAIVVSMGLKG